MVRAFCWSFAVALLCGCSPLTYETRTVQVHQLPAHPLPAGATYAVVIPPTSVGAAQLAETLRIPGFAKATAPDTAEVTIEANVGQATIENLKIDSGTVHRVISSGGSSEYTAYSYYGEIVVPSLLRIRSKTHGQVIAYDTPCRTNLSYDTDPNSQQRFTDPSTLEWAFNRDRPALLSKASRAEVQRLQSLAAEILVDSFTARKETIAFTLATTHKTDARFAQAANVFAQAAIGQTGDTTGLANRLQPALDLWQQITTSPIGDDDENRTAAKGAALYNQAVGWFLLDRLDDAQRAAIAAQGLGVEARTVSSLTYRIQDRRQRMSAQKASP
jgi:hypothetical protein